MSLCEEKHFSFSRKDCGSRWGMMRRLLCKRSSTFKSSFSSQCFLCWAVKKIKICFRFHFKMWVSSNVSQQQTYLKLFHLFLHVQKHLLQLSLFFGPLFSSGLSVLRLWRGIWRLSSRVSLLFRFSFRAAWVTFNTCMTSMNPVVLIRLFLAALLTFSGLSFQKLFETFDLILTDSQAPLSVYVNACVLLSEGIFETSAFSHEHWNRDLF